MVLNLRGQALAGLSCNEHSGGITGITTGRPLDKPSNATATFGSNKRVHHVELEALRSPATAFPGLEKQVEYVRGSKALTHAGRSSTSTALPSTRCQTRPSSLDACLPSLCALRAVHPLRSCFVLYMNKVHS